MVTWFPSEEAALTLPAGATVSQWAVEHRIFPKDASFPGPWDPRKAPYVVEPMNALIDPEVERITLIAGARSVKTETWFNMLGYIISKDPGPVLVVMPTENKVKRICKRITKMIKASPDLRQYLTGNSDDLQKKSIVLRHMEIIFATAGSAADLGEFEAKYIFESETDTYPVNVGDQGSPTQMAEMRGRTYWDRKIITESKPILEEGFISQDYARSDQRQFYVPCPWCGGYQVLDFWRLKHRGEPLMQWPPDHRDPDYIKAARAAVYECRFCLEEIEEHDKPEMIAAGVWGLEEESEAGESRARERGAARPATPAANTHQGYWWNALYSPFATWQEMTAKYFEVKDDRNQLRTFYNEWLGRPFKEVIKTRETGSLIEGEHSLKTRRPALEVPDNTVALTLGADNHKRGLAVTVWAWERLAPRIYNQHLIRYGWLADFQELEGWLFEDVYYSQDGSLVHRIWRAALDTGGGEGYTGDATLTEQAYEWLRSRGQGRVFGIKGASGRLATRRMSFTLKDKMPGGKPIPGGLKLWILDTHALKDSFWSRVEAGRVFFHGDTGEDFARQLTAEAREWDQKKKHWFWRQQGNQPNHYLDGTIYAAAMADPECWGGLDVLAMPEKPKAASAPELNPFTGQQEGHWLGR
jgi:phage terminase large subunit GpA-like protein